MTTYELTSSKIKGDFSISFKDGFLNGVKMDFKDCLNEAQHELLFGAIPLAETDLNKLAKLGFKVSRTLAKNQKIALFCEFYTAHKNGQKYKATGTDGNVIANFKVTPEILKAYFTSTNFLIVGEAGSIGRHSIVNFCKCYNLVLAELANAGKGKYPDHWSEAFEGKLDNQQRIEYFAHLRSLGLTVKKDRVGKTIDWIKI